MLLNRSQLLAVSYQTVEWCTLDNGKEFAEHENIAAVLSERGGTEQPV